MKKSLKIILISFIVLIIIGVIIFFVSNRTKKQEFTYITAEIGPIIQKVSVTGRIKPAHAVDLSFENSGKVSLVSVEIGDKVAKGQTLAALDNQELKSQLFQVQAQLEANEIKLQELEKGTRPEEISVAETAVLNAEKEKQNAEIALINTQTKAETDLANLYDDISDLLYDAYTAADDAVTKQTDEMFNNDSTDSPQLTFTTSDAQTKTSAEWQRVLSRDALSNLKTEIDELPVEYPGLDLALANAENYLTIIRNFLLALNNALNSAINTPESTINTYKGYVNTARVNVNAEVTSVSTQKQSISAQKAENTQNIAAAEAKVTTKSNTLAAAEKDLTLKQAGATEEQIEAQMAKVKESLANVQNINSKIAKTALYSPITGIITKQIAKTGEIIPANTVVVSIISESDYKIEANVPEVDISKVKINDIAEVMFEARNLDTKFTAKVTAIDPAETIIDGVATYKVTLRFIEENKEIKPGMTSDIDILTAKKENVIAIPARAIISRDNKKFVKILQIIDNNSIVEEVAVTCGIRGSNGNIEILNGIQQGDKVITLFER